VHLHHPPIDERLTKKGLLDMFPEPQHPTYRFAMAIDTNTCNGCMACVVACNLENNIPFIGPDQVRRGRTMTWIRMDRFWEGEGEHQDVRYLPALCQHCAHAPCEGVCPVLATYHNLDGLNAMIYNRCVGTRYCANNCPYTSRRFNYHTWEWPESMHLMLNPDVSVREMGVMEKCTFCIQRTRSVKDSWKDVAFKNRASADEAISLDAAMVPDSALAKLTACASACPTGAITFGNAKDETAQVSKKFASPRSYTLLAELNTKPGVRYLARVRHGGAHGGGHGAPAGGHAAAGGGEHGAAAEHAPAAAGHEGNGGHATEPAAGH
jgi:molybdopterin-containing oxidoreductase family iron-sulfur binding subunit